MTSSSNPRELIDRLLAFAPPDKGLGQHYLTDGSILGHAIHLSRIEDTDNPVVFEIGPGPGVLTERLLATGAVVHAVEIDLRSIEHLRRQFESYINEKQFILHHGDALKTSLPADVTHVISNPSYQLSSPLIKWLSDAVNRRKEDGGVPLHRVVLLLQEEFVNRLAPETSLDIGPLGIRTAFQWNVMRGRRVGARSFTPPPKVNSQLVVLEPHDLCQEYVASPDSLLGDIVEQPNLRLANMVVGHVFEERRKKIRNMLKKTPKRISRIKGWNREVWQKSVTALVKKEEEVGMEGLREGWLNMRPEEFNIDEWLLLAGYLHQCSKVNITQHSN